MRPVASLLACLIVLAPIAAAQEGTQRTRQDAEVANYQLSMDKMRKLLEVQRTLTAANQKNPQLFASIDQETEAAVDKNGGPLSASQRVAIVERHPEIKSLFTSAGWTARDWVFTSEAATMAYVRVHSKDGTVSAPPPTTAAEKANVALLERNAAETEKIMQELGRLGEEMTAGAEESE
jgi:hypothetical protein